VDSSKEIDRVAAPLHSHEALMILAAYGLRELLSSSANPHE